MGHNVNLWEFLWGLVGMWKPVTCVTAMHFFHHFAIYLSDFTLEEIWSVLSVLTDDPQFRLWIPYSVTWLFNSALAETISYFSWLGYRLRNEAQLWWLVQSYEADYEQKFIKFQWARNHPHDAAIQDEWESWIAENEKPPAKPRFFAAFYNTQIYSDSIPTRAPRGIGLPFKSQQKFGYEDVPTDDETEPQRPESLDVRIRFHNPDRDYQQGKPHYYYADPEKYREEELKEERKSLRDRYSNIINRRQTNARVERDKEILKAKSIIDPDSPNYNQWDDSDLSDSDIKLEQNERDRNRSNPTPTPSISRGYNRPSIHQQVNSLKDSDSEHDYDDDEDIRIAAAKAAFKQRQQKYQDSIRRQYDSDTETYTEGEPRQSIWRDQKDNDTQQFAWPRGDDPRDYL